MLDQLSGGRLELGVGRGVSPIESLVYGLKSIEESRARYRETLDIFFAACRSDVLDYQGQDVELYNKPVQKPYPPLWFPSSNRDSIEFTARHGYHTALLARLAVCEPSEERLVIAVPRGELDGIAVAAGEPERWIGRLHGLVVMLHVLALVVEDFAAAGSKENVERLAVAGARLVDAFQSVSQGFDGRNAATHAKLEPAARELVE